MNLRSKGLVKNQININELIPELLMGASVFHKKWLLGKICSIEKGYVKVEFESCDKTFQFPAAFNQFLKITDEETYKKQLTEYKNRKIVKKIEERKIERYVHFTNVENLDSILCEGLMSIQELNSRGLEYKHNDEDRLDHHLDATSLSISFPNYQMFYRYKCKNPSAKWIVICYDAKSIAQNDCAYFKENAASHVYINSRWDDFTSLDAFNTLFEGEREGLHDYETTNPQAEVMVKGGIPSEYIDNISFDDYALLKEYEKKYPNMKMCYNKHYFQPRRDYERWSKKDGN